MWRIQAVRNDPPLETTSVILWHFSSQPTLSFVIPQWTVMKSIPSLACFSIPLKMSSSVISTTAFLLAAVRPVW